MSGETFLPIHVWWDSRSAIDCVKMEGCHKLKTFDDNLEKVKKDLEIREQTGRKPHMAETHGDYIKQCEIEGKIRVEWIEGTENVADIMTKPHALQTFEYLSNKILGL